MSETLSRQQHSARMMPRLALRPRGANSSVRTALLPACPPSHETLRAHTSLLRDARCSMRVVSNWPCNSMLLVGAATKPLLLGAG